MSRNRGKKGYLGRHKLGPNWRKLANDGDTDSFYGDLNSERSSGGVYEEIRPSFVCAADKEITKIPVKRTGTGKVSAIYFGARVVGSRQFVL